VSHLQRRSTPKVVGCGAGEAKIPLKSGDTLPKNPVGKIMEWVFFLFLFAPVTRITLVGQRRVIACHLWLRSDIWF